MQTHVYKSLKGLVDDLDVGNALIGPLNTTVLRMPRRSIDGRKLTWNKLILQYARKVQNKNPTEDDCWFVKSNNSNLYHQKKISKTGSNNKWLSHRILYALRFPNMMKRLNLPNDDNQVAHKCGRGKAKVKGGNVCINPYHLTMTSKQINESQKSCRYGAAYLCPHKRKCVFTWEDTGKSKECFNLESHQTCECIRKCEHELNLD